MPPPQKEFSLIHVPCYPSGNSNVVSCLPLNFLAFEGPPIPPPSGISNPFYGGRGVGMDVFWNYTRLAYKEKQTSEFEKVYIYTFYNVKGTEKGYCNKEKTNIIIILVFSLVC